MAKKLKKFVPKRRDQTEDNQWLQKDLALELPLADVKPDSQFYMLQKNERGDGYYFRPVRVTLEDVLAGGVNIRDEGNAFTTYLPTEIFDEGMSNTTYTADETFDEGSS